MLKASKKTLSIAILSGALLLAGCESEEETPDGYTPTHVGITANFDDDTVTIFDAVSMAVTHANVSLSGAKPSAITLSTDNKTAYVMNSGTNDISIIDLLSGSEIGTIALSGTHPGRAVVAPNGYLYVTFEQSSFIAKVDIAATTPVEVTTIENHIDDTEGATAIAATPDGQFLYVGYVIEGGEDSYLGKIDIATESMVADFSNEHNDQFSDIEIDSNGILYATPAYEAQALYRFDTNTDTFTDSVGITYADMQINDLKLYKGKLFSTANAGAYSGGVAEVSINFAPNGFAYDSRDDNSDDVDYHVALPFDFDFFGESYNIVSVNSNGTATFNNYKDYENNSVLEKIIGFAPNNNDLDSSNLFNYSSKTNDHYAVFQWQTNTYEGSKNSNAFTSFEVILYSNGQARFDYLLSGPDAIGADDNFSYGVGNKTEIVNLRSTLGSPFGLTRKSYLWDPASPNIMTKVPFAWQGTGIHFNPAILHNNGKNGGGHVAGVGVTDDHIFMTVVNDYKDNARKEVTVYDRNTMLPLDASIPVGYTPRAIEIAKIPMD